MSNRDKDRDGFLGKPVLVDGSVSGVFVGAANAGALAYRLKHVLQSGRVADPIDSLTLRDAHELLMQGLPAKDREIVCIPEEGESV